MSSVNSLKVATIQLCSGLDPRLNLDKASQYLEKASSQSVEVVVLPEVFLSFGQKQRLSIETQKEFVEQLSELARSFQLTIIAGTQPLNAIDLLESCDEAQLGKPYASSCVFSPSKGLIGVYNKIHLFDVDVQDAHKAYRESADFDAGHKLCVIDLPQCRVGLAVCYDLRFPEMFIRLAARGCKVIFLPAAFTENTGRAHWETLIRARAIENQVFIVAANQGGRHENGRNTWGESMIVNPWGEVLSKLESFDGPSESIEDIGFAELNLEMIDELKVRMPMDQHRKLI